MVQIKFKRLRLVANPLPLPSYQSEDASGMDLLADVEDNVCLEPGERKLVATGLSMEIPSGYEAQIRPRSGLAVKHGISMVNTPGTIDSDYRGEIKIIMINHGSETFTIKRGDRIAQMVIAPVVHAEIVEITELSRTVRGGGGFGSTGS